MSQTDFTAIRALVIDDVSFTLQRLTKTLTQLGIPDVQASANGATACKLVETGEFVPNLIIADFQMPEMNGLELLKRVRTGGVKGLPHDVVFVILTGFLELSRSIPAVRLGADGLLSKPLTPAVAKTKLDQLFGKNAERIVRETDHYADMLLDSGGGLEAEIVENPGNEEKEFPILLVTPDAVLSRDLNYPNGELLLRKGSKINRALLSRLQEVAELSGGVHRLWVWL